MQQRDYSLDILRGFAILLVIFGHIQRIGGDVTNYIWSFHLPLFFFISGMLFTPEKYKNFAGFLKAKFVGLVLPYILFYLLSYFYWLFIERHFRGGDISPLQYLIGLPYGTYDVRYNDFNGSLWFLPALFSVEVIYYWVGKLKSYVGIILSLIGLFMGGYILREQFRPLPWGMAQALISVCFYGFGNLFVRSGWYDKAVGIPGWLKLSIILVLLIVHAILMPYTGVDLCILRIDHPIFYIPVAFVGIGCYFYIAQLMKRNAVLEWLGKSSLVLFAFHGQVFRAVLYVESRLLNIEVDAVRQDIALCLVCLVVVVLLIWPINFVYVKLRSKLILETPLPKLPIE